MFALLYNRLTGWMWFVIGIWSLFSPKIGDYIHVTSAETYLTLGLGLLGMAGARSHWRNQVLVCLILTLSNLIVLLITGTPFASVALAPTPLEGVLQFLCVVWGIYCLYHEVKQWIVRIRTAA